MDLLITNFHNISHILLLHFEDAIKCDLISALTGRTPPNDIECDLFALPARFGCLGRINPSKTSDF